MILVVDHYDSFVHNLARYAVLTGQDCTVRRCDVLTVEEASHLNPDAIILSPGPCTPKESGISVDLIRRLGPHIPIFGVCLGHQCIGEAFGAPVFRTEPMHGMASAIHHDGSGIFKGLPQAFEAGRYHSLAVEPGETSPLTVIARTQEGIVMGMKHQIHPIYGVQFHPESILTPHGAQIMENFIAIACEWRKAARRVA